LAACSSSSNPPPAVLPLGGSAAPPAVTSPSTAAGAPAAPTAPIGNGTAGAAAGAAGTPASSPVTPTTPTTPSTPTTPVTPGEGGPVTTTPAASSDWAMMGYDLGSTYNNTAETKLTKANAAMLTEAYTVDMGGNVYGAPLQIGDKIYASGNTIRALNAADGTELWRAMVGSTSSMAYANGVLYCNDNNGQIHAINALDGKELWKKPVDKQSSDGSSSPLVAGDVILIGGSNGGAELGGGVFRGYMSALKLMTGEIAWTTYTVPEGARGASMWSSPSADLALGLAFGGTGNNYGAPATDTSDAFIGFDLKAGTIKWKNQRVMGDTFGGGVGPDADFGANPVLFDTPIGGAMTKVVAAGNKGGKAHAVRRDDGMLLWERSLCGGSADGSRGVFVNSSWSGKHVIIACNEGGPSTLYALDGATGNISWMRRLTSQVWGRLSIANGVGFVGVGSTLEVFDIDSGTTIKSFPSKGGTVAGTISISNGRVAFGEGLTWSGGRAGRTLTVLKVP
jgi:outer membrane protein assembly factor BamB